MNKNKQLEIKIISDKLLMTKKLASSKQQIIKSRKPIKFRYIYSQRQTCFLSELLTF